MQFSYLVTISVLSLTLLLGIVAGVFTLFQPRLRFSTLCFTAYFVGFAVWSGGILANLLIGLHHALPATFRVGDLPYFVEQIIFLAPILLLTGQLWFVRTFPNGKFPRNVTAYWPLALSIALTCITVIPNTLFTHISITPAGYTLLDQGPFTGLYTVFLLIHYGYVAYELYRKKKSEQSPIIRRQTTYLFWSHITSFAIGTVCNWILPVYFGVLTFNAFGPVATLIAVAAFAYAVTHYRFLDIRLSLQRALTYTATAVVTIGAIAAVTLHVPKDDPYLLIFANTATLLTCAVLFSPLFNACHSMFNVLIFGKLRNYQDELNTLIEHTGTIIRESANNLPVMTAALAREITACFGVRDIAFATSSAMAGLPTANSAVWRDLQKNAHTIVRDEAELADGEAATAVVDELSATDTRAAVPLTYDGEMVGALLVRGERAKTFSVEEITALETIGAALAREFQSATTCIDAKTTGTQNEFAEQIIEKHVSAVTTSYPTDIAQTLLAVALRAYIDHRCHILPRYPQHESLRAMTDVDVLKKSLTALIDDYTLNGRAPRVSAQTNATTIVITLSGIGYFVRTISSHRRSAEESLASIHAKLKTAFAESVGGLTHTITLPRVQV